MELKNKIAVLCDYRLMPERVGGMDRFFWLFDAECKALGHEIVWFFPNDSRHEGYSQLAIIAANGKSIEQTFLAYNQSFDVVFTHFLELCTPFFKMVKKKDSLIKVFCVVHVSSPVGGYPLKKQIFKWIKGLLYSNYVDFYITVSDFTKRELRRQYIINNSKKIIVINNGIDTSLFLKKTYKLGSNKFKFIIASHLVFEKGIQDVIDAVYLLDTKVQEKILIHIYGKGSYTSHLEKKIKDYNLNSVFEFKGSVSNLFEIYSKYDYLIHSSYKETFCFTVLESLISNTPVITTNTPGGNILLEIKEDKNGYLYDSKDIKSLSQILEEIVEGKRVIKDDVSKEVIEKYSLEKMVANYLKLV